MSIFSRRISDNPPNLRRDNNRYINESNADDNYVGRHGSTHHRHNDDDDGND